MEYDEIDSEVVRLLASLRETGSSYPTALLAARRERFVKQIAAFGFGVGAAIVLKETAKAVGGSSIPSVVSTILETALVVAIVAEAGYVAIVHREKILDWFRTISLEPAVEVVATAPDSKDLPGELPVTGPTFVPTIAEPVVTVTATATVVIPPTPPLPVMTVTVNPAAPGGTGDNGDSVQGISTPQPHEDNGNHYGQTPRAERTRQSGGGGGGSDPKEDGKTPKDHRDPKK